MKKEVEKQLNEIEKKMLYIDEQFRKEILSKYEPGKEYLVHYGTDSMWCDYRYIVNGVIYRMRRCLELINRIEGYIYSLQAKEQTVIAPYFECDHLSYVFEDLLIAFSKLNEDQLINEICRYIPRGKQRNLRENCYKKDDVDGLYWKINLLRNRSAHSTPGYYTTVTRAGENEQAARYNTISSQISRIEYNPEKEEIKLQTTLINLDKNSDIKEIIQKDIIDGGSKVPVMDLIFPNTKPLGHNKRNPTLLLLPIQFDLYNDFFTLCIQMLQYISVQLKAFVN